MAWKEQQKIMDELKRQQHALKGKDLYDFQMLLKRHKDEEEFDSVSFKRLKELSEKYNVKKSKDEALKKYDKFFKK